MKKYNEPLLEIIKFSALEPVCTEGISLAGNAGNNIEGTVPVNWTYDGD